MKKLLVVLGLLVMATLLHGGVGTTAANAWRPTTITKTRVIVSPGGQVQQGIARCPKRQVATGGGFFFFSQTPDLTIVASFPGAEEQNGREWVVQARNTSADEREFGVYVVCIAR